MENSCVDAKRILVVEDEPVICNLCRRVLTSDGFEVEIAGDGKIAQDMVGDKAYDFALVDIRTPTMNGQQLYQWLQEKHPQLANRVIFTTGNIMDMDTLAFIEQTGRLYLPKPFTPDELRAIMREALKEIEE